MNRSNSRIYNFNFSTFAERRGFEPRIPFWGIHAFQACLFNHSSTSPYGYRAAKVMVIFEIRNKILLILILYQQKDYITKILHFFPPDIAVLKNIPIFAPANKKGAIAQLVEQRTENPCVPGSIPGGTTFKSGM